MDEPVKQPRVGHVCREWWRDLQPVDAGGHVRPGVDRGVLARLKRASSIQELAVQKATVDLCRRLMAVGRVPEGAAASILLPKAALIAGVLSHVAQDFFGPEQADARRYRSTATVLGRRSDGERPLLSEDRFRQLMAAEEEGDALRTFRLVVGLADRTLPVFDLAESLFDWTDAYAGSVRRRKWAFDFYGSAASDAA